MRHISGRSLARRRHRGGRAVWWLRKRRIDRAVGRRTFVRDRTFAHASRAAPPRRPSCFRALLVGYMGGRGVRARHRRDLGYDVSDPSLSPARRALVGARRTTNSVGSGPARRRSTVGWHSARRRCRGFEQDGDAFVFLASGPKGGAKYADDPASLRQDRRPVVLLGLIPRSDDPGRVRDVHGRGRRGRGPGRRIHRVVRHRRAERTVDVMPLTPVLSHVHLAPRRVPQSRDRSR